MHLGKTVKTRGPRTYRFRRDDLLRLKRKMASTRGVEAITILDGPYSRRYTSYHGKRKEIRPPNRRLSGRTRTPSIPSSANSRQVPGAAGSSSFAAFPVLDRPGAFQYSGVSLVKTDRKRVV